MILLRECCVSPESALTLRRLQELPDGLELFRGCFRANGMPKSAEHLRWQFERSPTDGRLVTFAIDEPAGAVAGIYAVFRSSFKVGPVTRPAVQSLDTITDQRYRGRGLFPKLATHVYEQCREDSVAFVYGFPNGSSAPGFFGKLGWVNLDPVPFLIKPLRAAYVLRRFASALAGRWSSHCLPWAVPARPLPQDWHVQPWTSFGEDANRIWREFREVVGVALERDANYLNWRFSRRPASSYRTMAVYDASGSCRGFVTFTCMEKHGGTVGYIMELLAAPADQTAMTALLGVAVADLAEQGAEVLLAWSLPGAPTHRAFRRSGFLSLPERLRPIELHFGVRSFDPELTAFLSDHNNWYLSYADSDTV
jgi:GNAT superfamily N-acetyltransferase